MFNNLHDYIKAILDYNNKHPNPNITDIELEWHNPEKASLTWLSQDYLRHHNLTIFTLLDPINRQIPEKLTDTQITALFNNAYQSRNIQWSTTTVDNVLANLNHA